LAQRAADQAVEHDNPLEEVYEDQLLCADLVILNKSDLLDAETSKRVLSEITASLPRAIKIVATKEGAIDPAVLLGLMAAAEDDLANRPSHHDTEAEHDHDDFDSFVMEIGATQNADALLTQLQSVVAAHDILRIKGFVEVTGKPMRLLVQGVGSRFRSHFDRAWAVGETRHSRLVVIGEKGLDREAIRRAFAA
jgi:cobalamin biosynthesis protein CobW